MVPSRAGADKGCLLRKCRPAHYPLTSNPGNCLMRPYAALVLAITLAACDVGFEPNVNFTHSLLPPGPAENSVSVVGSSGALFAVGVLVGPNACQRLVAASRTDRSVITITITATSSNSNCPAGGGAYSYSLGVEGLDRGVYTARVVYNFGSQQPSVTVAESEIRIT